MTIKANEFSVFSEKGKAKLIEKSSNKVLDKKLTEKLTLELHSINNYFVEVLCDETGKQLSVKQVSIDYVSKFYCFDNISIAELKY
jgi:hypothetical protein